MWSETSLNIPVKFAIKEGIHTEALELHFGSVAPGGCMGVPKGRVLKYRSRIQTRFARGVSLNSYAERFIDSYNVIQSIVEQAHSRCLVRSRPSKGNHVAVGDAAGMVLPSNGAGITIAMIGGRIAANAIADHILDGKTLTSMTRSGNVRWVLSC